MTIKGIVCKKLLHGNTSFEFTEFTKVLEPKKAYPVFKKTLIMGDKESLK